jgi:hypothetical protein
MMLLVRRISIFVMFVGISGSQDKLFGKKFAKRGAV